MAAPYRKQGIRNTKYPILYRSTPFLRQIVFGFPICRAACQQGCEYGSHPSPTSRRPEGGIPCFILHAQKSVLARASRPMDRRDLPPYPLGRAVTPATASMVVFWRSETIGNHRHHHHDRHARIGRGDDGDARDGHIFPRQTPFTHLRPWLD